MAHIELRQVCVDFPIYNASSRSLKKQLVRIGTGGRLGADTAGRVVVRAMDGLSVAIKDGDRVGVVGHNGAGKSTFLRLLAGVYEPTSGQLSCSGEIGSLIDISLGIDPEATGRENIFLRGAMLGMSKRETSGHFDDIVEFSELGEFIEMPVRTYSTGMHLRLAFAVSTVMRPQILLMDEWLSVGDEAFKHKVEARMKAMVQASDILVLATHSRELIERTCNRVLWLEHGVLKMDGSPNEICAQYFSAG